MDFILEIIVDYLNFDFYQNNLGLVIEHCFYILDTEKYFHYLFTLEEQ